jgi:hypothetical protein
MTPDDTIARSHRFTLVFVYTMLSLGIVFRLVWNTDMEWKTDEKLMYRMANEAVQSARLPETGMMSGGGIVNPGFSVAPFAFFAFFTDSPLTMNRMVQLLNIAAIIGLLLFVNLRLNGIERQVWLFALALVAVSPMAVVYSRKIWAQDTLPIFCLALLASNHYRRSRAGAFLWGLAGALIGQIHMSGFFYAAGMFVFTVLHDRVNRRSFSYPWWIAGALLGVIPMFEWIQFMMTHPSEGNLTLGHVLQLNFFLYLLFDAFGLNLLYILRDDFMGFLQFPYVGHFSFWLPALCHLLLAAAGVYTLTVLVRKTLRNRHAMLNGAFLKNATPSTFYLGCIFTAGLFMTFSGTSVFPHYIIGAFPMQYLLVAKLLAERKRLLMWLTVVQALLTLLFLVYIHVNGGAPNGDYGVAYSRQLITLSQP